MNETNDTRSFRIDYRHLAFFFLGAVCVCAVFFALGFVVGRAQAFEMALNGQEEVKNMADAALNAPPTPASVPSSGERLQISTAPLDKPEASRKSGSPGADYRKDLDFYSAVKEPKLDQNFHPESPKARKASVAMKKTPAAAFSSGGASAAPRSASPSPAGLVSLQVAALKSSSDAGRLAKTLRTKGYPVFIVNAAKDDPSKLIRVQIGPYTNEAEAAKVRARLGAEGYTAITKR
ncbi:MAG: SPOR domain-containing protein [Acidobacteria bacterium]|nr:SPOR domain-containing protein [Acidobacteriota bacterium]